MKVSINKSYPRCAISSKPRLMLFDLAVGGHHPSYIRHLVEYWRNEKMEGRLFIVVSPEFLEKHEDVVGLANSSTEFVATSPEETSSLSRKKGILHRAFFEWKIHCKYAAQLHVNHSLLMYFDHLQLPIVFGPKSPCPVSGIYFRPSFHYKYFENSVLTLKDSWRGWRQKVLLSLALKNRQLSGLLSLDQYAVPYIKALSQKNKHIEHLPDPVTVVQLDPLQVQSFKKNLGIEAGRKVFLLFGQLTERKGIFQVLEALKLLKQDVARKFCLLLVGEIHESIKAKVLECITDLCQESSVQIIIQDTYHSEDTIPLYVSAADVVLAPYQRHVGMSGVLMLSFAYRKPILSSNFGLLGKLTQEYELGEVVNTSNPKLLSGGILSFLDQSTNQTLKLTRITSLFSQHNPYSFSRHIFSLISGV